MMKMIRIFVVLLMATAALASLEVNAPIVADEERGPVIALDDQCIVDFQSYVYGPHASITLFPGGSTNFRLSSMCFTTTNCASLPDTFYTYCTDLNHTLNLHPYCVQIDPCVVDNTYPAVIPAVAWIFSTYDAVDAQTDRIKQLSIWKLSTDRSGGPNNGIPYVNINDGRGYPNVGDAPVYPYVNTVFNNDPLNNSPANLVVLDALGYDPSLNPTGVAKNVVNCGDQFLIATDPVVIEGGTATICATITLVRGAYALSVGNTSVSGVWVDLAELNNIGALSTTGEFTDALGQVHVCISQPVSDSYSDVRLQVCSDGIWPLKLEPCPGSASQILVLISGDRCEVCEVLDIPGDSFLPVELASFTATAGAHGITVAWRTSSESELDRFELSRNGVLVEQVSAANSAIGSSYSYFDANVTSGVTYVYELASVTISGEREELATASATPRSGGSVVSEFALYQNYPNPFNPETSIRFDLMESANVTLSIYNIAGQEVATLVNGTLSAGSHTVNFDGGNLTSGVYLYRLTAGSFTAQKKMVLLK